MLATRQVQLRPLLSLCTVMLARGMRGNCALVHRARERGTRVPLHVRDKGLLTCEQSCSFFLLPGCPLAGAARCGVHHSASLARLNTALSSYGTAEALRRAFCLTGM